MVTTTDTKTIAMPIDEALCDDSLLGAALGANKATWSTWTTMLRAAAGLQLITERQRQTFAAAAGGRKLPRKMVREFWAIVGRGGGKSRVAAACAVHVALLQKHKLAAGETGHVLVLSQTVGQARVVFDYAMAFVEQSPILRQEIESTTQSEIRLRNNIIIATHPASFRSVRGRSLLACIFDESSFWRDESSALPDIEAYRAVLPSLIRTGGQLIGISTPYRKLGLLYQKYKKHFAVDDDDVLVVQGDSRIFNPTLSEADIVKAMADDPEAAISEWHAEFRTDIAAFLSDEDIDACVDFDRPAELSPRDTIGYHAFADPSGGRHDAFTLCIAHKEDERTIVDVLRGRYPPFDVTSAVDEYAALLREYRIREVIGDNYAAEWVEQAFRSAGIKYTRSELPKGRLYIEGLPAFTRRTVSLPNHPRLLRELRLLERRPHVGGKDTVDHGRTGSDDHANALFGVLRHAAKRKPRMRMFIGYLGHDDVVEVDIKTGEPIKKSEWFPGFALKGGPQQHAIPGPGIKMEPVKPGAPDPVLQRRLRMDLWRG